MSEKREGPKVFNTLRVVPFTGAIFAIWAFFDPDGYGNWLGTIVRAFKHASGL